MQRDSQSRDSLARKHESTRKHERAPRHFVREMAMNPGQLTLLKYLPKLLRTSFVPQMPKWNGGLLNG